MKSKALLGMGLSLGLVGLGLSCSSSSDRTGENGGASGDSGSSGSSGHGSGGTSGHGGGGSGGGGNAGSGSGGSAGTSNNGGTAGGMAGSGGNAGSDGQIDAAAPLEVRDPVDAAMPPTGAPYVYTTKGWGATGVNAFKLGTDGTLTPVMNDDATSVESSLTLGSVEAGKQFLYFTSEVDMGAVVAFSIDKQTGAVTELGSQSTGVAQEVDLAISPNGRWLFAVNLGSAQAPAGLVVSMPIKADGTLGPVVSKIACQGGIHGVAVHPSGKFVYASSPYGVSPDNCSYTFDDATGKLGKLQTAVAGPKSPHHMVFSADGKFAYVSDESGPNVAVMNVDTTTGNLTLSSMTALAPAANAGGVFDVKLTPDGKHLVAAVRGAASNDFAGRGIYLIPVKSDGSLDQTAISFGATAGGYPRDLAIEKTSTFVVVASVDDTTTSTADGGAPDGGDTTGGSGSLMVFKIGTTGSLSAVGSPVGGAANRTTVVIVE